MKDSGSAVFFKKIVNLLVAFEGSKQYGCQLNVGASSACLNVFQKDGLWRENC